MQQNFNILEYGEKYKKDITTRQEKCAAILLKSAERVQLREPRGSQAIKSNMKGKIDSILWPADENIFLQDIIGLEKAKLTLIQAILLPVGVRNLVEGAQRWKAIVLFGMSIKLNAYSRKIIR